MTNPRFLLVTASLAFAAGAGPASAQRTIEDLGWIAGHWGGSAFGGEAEEGWFTPSGAAMSGVFRLVRDGEAVVYELLLIEQDADGEIHYRFKHVGPGWEPWEETPNEYRLTELTDRKATFRSTAETPPEGAPWWFTYERPDDDHLIVTVHGAGGEPIVLALRRR